MMRKSLVLILVAATMWPAADGRLRVYSCSGKVEMDAGGRWRQVVVRNDVTRDTRLQIAPGAVVEVLDTDTRRIYASIGSGATTVGKLMDRADRHAADVVGRTNAAIIEASRDNARSKPRYERGGVSMHNTEASAADSLSLRQLFADRGYSDRADVVLMRKENSTDGSSFYFAVFNTLDHPVYVNVVASPDLPLRFLFPVNVLAAPRSETPVPEYIFAAPAVPESYALIGCDHDFTASGAAALVDRALPGFHVTVMHP